MALEIPVPKWLNVNFIQSCLQEGKTTNSVEVIELVVCPAVSPGNNFASSLLQVKVDYKDNQGNNSHKTFVVKAPLTDGLIVKDFCEQFSFTEPSFYNEYLPVACKISTNYQFTPKSYFSGYQNVIILEDLKAKGYIMADRCKQLDFDHCRLYAEAAATMHAVSVAVYKQQPELVNKLGFEKLFSEKIKAVEPFKVLIERVLVYFSEKLENMFEYKQYSESVRTLSSFIWGLLANICEPNDTFNTLNQGDPWTANMMFKYDSTKKVTDIKLLDFQALRYASPFLDIVYFIWSSANDEVHENNLEEFYLLYCNSLNARLEEFKCPEKILYEQLQEQMQVLSPFIIVVASCFYPFLTNNKPLDLEGLFNESLEGESILLSEYYNEEFCKIKLPRLLQQLKSVGVLDYVKTYRK